MMNDDANNDIVWQPHADTARWVNDQLRAFVAADPFVAHLEHRMLAETGTRLIDWIDHFGFIDADDLLVQIGYRQEESVWRHHLGLFPIIRIADLPCPRLAVKVESVSDFLFAHQIDAAIEGRPGSPWRAAKVSQSGSTEFWIVERHGTTGFSPIEVADSVVTAALAYAETFVHRRRELANDLAAFDLAEALIRNAMHELGVDWTCDLFFAAERRFWQSRNHAGQIQKSRQDRLGLGWANHDHHTYRSSRQYFSRLIEILELLGFNCRERFYGGRQAGWGAQVMQQPKTGIVIFADVDLTPEEVTGDFAHDGLTQHDQLGTVGLWCKLHGEAFLTAGMHHLECQFDFDQARDQLAKVGVQTMAPFTDFSYLKQAFTAGEIWPVAEHRMAAALADGSITASDAEKFRQSGSIGSHLEILQRNEGYKGFNQTGISEIIRQTDPRRS